MARLVRVLEQHVAGLVVVFWRDIPAQVKAGSGRQTVRRELPPRFAEAIDAAAMRSGAKDSDSYLAEWRTGAPVEIEGDVSAAVEHACAALEAEWDHARLQAAVAAGGREST
jgi:hypothetical protein